MAIVLLGPEWFNPINSVPEMISLVISLIIIGATYKAYKLTKDRKFFFFGLSFAFIALSFISKIAAELIIRSEARESIMEAMRSAAVIDFGQIGFVLTTLLAYVALMMLVFKVHDKRLVSMFCVFTFLFALFAYKEIVLLHILSIIILGFITSVFFENYNKKKHMASLFVFLSFLLQTIAHVFYIIANYNGRIDPLAEGIHMLGYLSLLIAIIYCFKK